MNLKLYNHLDSYANENCCRGGLMNSTKKISIINTQIINELGYKEIMQRKNLKSSIIPHNENENNNPNNQNRRISPNLLGLKQSNIRKKSSDEIKDMSFGINLNNHKYNKNNNHYLNKRTKTNDNIMFSSSVDNKCGVEKCTNKNKFEIMKKKFDIKTTKECITPIKNINYKKNNNNILNSKLKYQNNVIKNYARKNSGQKILNNSINSKSKSKSKTKHSCDKNNSLLKTPISYYKHNNFKNTKDGTGIIKKNKYKNIEQLNLYEQNIKSNNNFYLENIVKNNNMGFKRKYKKNNYIYSNNSNNESNKSIDVIINNNNKYYYNNSNEFNYNKTNQVDKYRKINVNKKICNNIIIPSSN